jgi:hypothetical protein
MEYNSKALPTEVTMTVYHLKITDAEVTVMYHKYMSFVE